MTDELKIILTALLVCIALSIKPAEAGAFAVVKSAPVTSAGVSGSTAIVQVAQPYTLQQAGQNVQLTAANQFSVGAGTGSPAAAIANAALGIGGVAAGVFASPALGAAMAALTIGSIGYQLYQEMKQQGFTVNPDGTATFSGTTYNWGGTTYSDLTSLGGAASGMFGCMNSSQSLRAVVGGMAVVDIMGFRGNAGALCASIEVQVGSVSRPATAADAQSAVTNATTKPAAAADAVNYALSKDINPLSYMPSTALNLATAPQTATLPDGSTVTVTPPSTLGGSETISPVPTSTMQEAPTANTGTTPAITLPTDYARQGEAATAANTVRDAITANEFCTKNPGAAACENLANAQINPNVNVPDAVALDLTNKTISVQSITPVLVSSSQAVCPAPRPITIGGMPAFYSYEIPCNFAASLSPVILSFAWLVAAGILIGGIRNG